jgi:hypothetical protein
MLLELPSSRPLRSGAGSDYDGYSFRRELPCYVTPCAKGFDTSPLGLSYSSAQLKVGLSSQASMLLGKTFQLSCPQASSQSTRAPTWGCIRTG